jgi:hypothetical protein
MSIDVAPTTSAPRPPSVQPTLWTPAPTVRRHSARDWVQDRAQPPAHGTAIRSGLSASVEIRRGIGRDKSLCHLVDRERSRDEMQREIDTAAGYPNPALVLANLGFALRRRIRRPPAFPIPMQPERRDHSKRQCDLGTRRRRRGETRIKRDGRRAAQPCLDDTTKQSFSLEQSKQPHVFPRCHFFLGLRSNTQRLDVHDISPRSVFALKRLG